MDNQLQRKMSRGGGAAQRDVPASDFETSASVKVVESFDTMGLSEDLIRGIYAYGKPTFPLPSASLSHHAPLAHSPIETF